MSLREALKAVGATVLVIVVLPSAILAATGTPFPFTPPREIQRGDLVVGVSEWDGEGWTLVGGLTVQPEAFCTAPVRPERPAG